MDESIEEGDSLFSLPGRPNVNPRSLYHTPPQASGGNRVGLGLDPTIVPAHLPESEESFEQPNRWSGASPPDISTSYEYPQQGEEEEEDGIPVEEQGEEEEDEDGEGSYAASEGSSAQYDPEADPETFARRLDELAGILEISEQESNANKWGIPIINKKNQDIPLHDFRSLINLHLTSTEWKYSSPALLVPLPGRTASFGGGLPMNHDTVIHPIRVLGRGWTDRDDWLDDDSDSMQVEA
ncbi:uncharacterized protein IL334_002040 [Kwoniella shivajii]|uniref:Anaphase-promoting complex subunit 13 n=1 Tax=Kwoniella shivajii TaxID=564305 RepID=A0ABZ1CU91_9TREE|nr:hypothetical protein IL334_002040 [Kwoniella shivajii]